MVSIIAARSAAIYNALSTLTSVFELAYRHYGVPITFRR